MCSNSSSISIEDDATLEADVKRLLGELDGLGVLVRDDVRAQGTALLRWRRLVHRLAETSFQEHQTAALVEAHLRTLEGVSDIRTGIAKTGVTALIQGTRPCAAGEEGAERPLMIMCRADMDALPIPERTGLPFAATNGNSHACGHDGHVAMLLAAATCLSALRGRFRGAVLLLFQPAEEGGGGAREMLREEALAAQFGACGECYGAHLWNTEAVGTVGATPGANMANSDRWRIEVVGSGGHGALPHETADPIVAAAAIVTALQTVVSRNVDPLDSAVLTVGTIHGGTAPNVIPGAVELGGTARTLRGEVQERLIAAMRRVAEGVAAGHGASVVFEYGKNYPATVSTEAEVGHVRGAAARVVGGERVRALPPVLAGEDFSFFLQRRPGCFFFVGSGPAGEGAQQPAPHHRADFVIHEGALFVGASIWIELVLDRLK